MTRAARTAVLIACLTLGACAGITSHRTPAPSAEVTAALELYANGQHKPALAVFDALLAGAELNSGDRRRVLAGAALIHLQQGGPANLNKARERVEAFTALNAGPIAPEFFLLRESLDTAIDAALAAHKKQHEARRENTQLRREVTRLEETLTKLRELTLE